MRTFLKIVGGILLFLIIVAIGLNLYFTDERLKTTVMPYVDEAVGRPVQVETMSLSFFSTFPQPGVTIENMSIPGQAVQDTVVALDELAVGVKLFSLFGDEIEFSEIELTRPRINYEVYADSTTNLDFFFNEEADTASEGTAINIPFFEIHDGRITYTDATSNIKARMEDVDAEISLRSAELLESEVDLQIGGLYATIDSTEYVTGLPLSLTETSTINLEEETADITEGTLSIKGLALNISGDIQSWGTRTRLNLTFNSSSDNFGELLRLVPEKYESHVENLETRGTLAIEGNINGSIGGEEIPAFTTSFNITDGYLKNPDLEEPIEDIQLVASMSNELLTVEEFNARAGNNQLSGKGSLQNPLEENGEFMLDINGDINLATVGNFVDLSEFDIENLAGQLNLMAQATGNRSTPKEANFNADILLENGTLKYTEVPEPVEQINIDASATQKVVDIKSMNLKAADNSFSLQGRVNNPLDETTRTIDLETDLSFDLATVKDFYPLDKDTLEMSGMLTAHATLQGKADQIEKSVQSGSINLTDGMIDYKEIGKPFRDVTLESVLEGNKLTIVNASFKSGENDMKVTGLVTDYLSDTRKVNLKLNGHAELNEITDYYEPEGISSLTGTADMNLRVEGPVSTPAEMAFNGNLVVNNLNAEGDSLPQSVQNLNAELTLTPIAATLKKLTMNLGSSDIDLSGSFQHYMEYLKEEENRKVLPQLTGNFKSSYFNVDELIDWTDTTETEEKILIKLPDLNSSVTATIDKLIVTGIEMQNLKAKASTTPNQIKLEQASINMFEGKASGSFIWDVPRPDRTTIAFKGSLDSLRAESFFQEYDILGEDSNFHEYISGAFSADVDYSSGLDVYLTPQISSADMQGSFGMTKSRLQGHPVQDKIADFLKTKEFRNIALDQWHSNFNVENGTLNISNLKLTSGDIGLELNGTQHLVNGKLDYDVAVLLPSRFKKGIASVITQQAADALTRENGTVMVPLHITGTQSNPKVEPNEDVIKPILQDYLKDKAGNALKKLFGN